MRLGQFAIVGLPGFGHEHQLGGGRIAARPADRLEHGVQRSGIGRTRRNDWLDILRLLAECEAGHLDLVAFHPVLVAADGVDLTIMGKRAERLGQPPLRESVGRIALVEDRHPALEPLILQIGIEYRQRFGEEQPLVDDGPARQATDIEIIDLRRDHLLFDPATDQIEVLLELGLITHFGHRPGDHDLLDFGTRALRLFADDGHVHRHLAPAIDGIACVDDLALNDGAAGFLRTEVRARQEDHADSQAVGQRLVTGVRDRIVKEAHRQVDMDTRAIASLAIGVDRAPMPHGLQRIDRGGDDATRRAAVGRGNEAHATGVAFQVRMIHALGGDPRAFFGACGEGSVCHDDVPLRSCVASH